MVLHIHCVRPRGRSGGGSWGAGLRRAAASSGTLLWALLTCLWGLGPTSTTFVASGPVSEVVGALGTVGAIPIFDNVGALSVALPRATPSGSSGTEVSVQVVEKTLNVTQGRLTKAL